MNIGKEIIKKLTKNHLHGSYEIICNDDDKTMFMVNDYMPYTMYDNAIIYFNMANSDHIKFSYVVLIMHEQ